MGDIAIKVENLSKAYQLGDFGTGTLSRDIERKWALLRGKEDPFLRVGETNDRSTAGSSDVVWSLKDINFEIKKGDAVGVIGRNGAGKSTLLKVLSRVTVPTVGSVKIMGRVASLLEVGTGFHPELTGRENIFLNGAILGMRKHEIKKHFDAIVDFAGVERYIDTPVKRYSSGMYVRLAFAVAAHLESEILIVDEVLAVGDAEFQKKCLGKMGEVSKGEGRTVLFVSHNMAAINNLCNKSLLLKHGLLQDYDDTRVIIDKYINSGKESQAEVLGADIQVKKFCSRAIFCALRLVSSKRGITTNFATDEEVVIEFEYEILVDNTILSASIHLIDNMGTCVFSTFNGPSATINVDEFYGKPLVKGKYKSICKIPPSFLNTKNYSINAFLVPENMDDLGIAEEVLSFSMEETGAMRKEYTGEWWGIVRPRLYWSTERM
ncbi:ABC transporter ATP-binding protein [Mucilaginibacter psychrotolerans]|uniref:ABC transporter ATP-binding protein n=1 Tax=Mucilaginibacter psychrotolerans TaxID=1524096 RepID=A0A4Y8SK37_9SPHI|nr:ABC transporter ATP-binding protein [Mucilaginibacter psychrotolerans]TFF38824.1 ABC transporter ATP-binding protein [Mucilaginibacter psychrotolerans]